jgi:hypothetical protein
VMTFSNAIARAAALAAVIAASGVCVLAQTEATPGAEGPEAPTAQPVGHDLDFSLFGATRGESVRLNAVFVVAPESRAEMADAQIEVELILLDGQGNLLKRSAERLLPRRGRPWGSTSTAWRATAITSIFNPASESWPGAGRASRSG